MEIERVQRLFDLGKGMLRVSHLGQAAAPGGPSFPIYGLAFGSEDPRAPCLGFFAGVHGLEHIGTSVLLTALESWIEQWRWDSGLREELAKFRLVSIPIVNPVGVFLRRRSNGNGVDLMRNAPIDGEGRIPWILGGHRLSSKLPFYRGLSGGGMEIESQALCQFVEREMFGSRVALTLDIHSGFGARDRLWYPFAKTKSPFPHSAQVQRIEELLDRSVPYHVYKVEPQSASYTTHGDLWDYLFERHSQAAHQNLFIPWTLEIGSWNWVRKNPSQIFSVGGLFDPILPHRRHRVFRRHLLLFYFFKRLIQNPGALLKTSDERKL